MVIGHLLGAWVSPTRRQRCRASDRGLSAATRSPMRIIRRPTDWRIDGDEAATRRRRAASRIWASRRSRAWSRSIIEIMCFSPPFSSVFVVGFVLLDVVVEGAAGVGHEHVFERLRTSGLPGGYR